MVQGAAPVVYIWSCEVPAVMHEKLRRNCCRIVSPTERQQLGRIMRRHGNGPRYNQVLVTRSLCRRVLSWAYAGPIAPADWQLGHSATGRPIILNALPAMRPKPAFSLSHTCGMVVCAVSNAALVGVDVEALGRQVQVMRLAQRFFAPHEITYMRALAARPRQAAFMALWTLKEAYLKSTDTGIVHLSPKVAFRLQRGGGAQFVGRPWVGERGVHASVDLSAESFCVSVVARTRSTVPPTFISHNGWPSG